MKITNDEAENVARYINDYNCGCMGNTTPQEARSIIKFGCICAHKSSCCGERLNYGLGKIGGLIRCAKCGNICKEVLI